MKRIKLDDTQKAIFYLRESADLLKKAQKKADADYSEIIKQLRKDANKLEKSLGDKTDDFDSDNYIHINAGIYALPYPDQPIEVVDIAELKKDRILFKQLADAITEIDEKEYVNSEEKLSVVREINARRMREKLEFEDMVLSNQQKIYEVLGGAGDSVE